MWNEIKNIGTYSSDTTMRCSEAFKVTQVYNVGCCQYSTTKKLFE